MSNGRSLPQPPSKSNPVHLLDGHWTHGSEFPSKVPSLLEELTQKLEVSKDRLDFTEHSLDDIDRAMAHVGWQRCLQPDLFSAIVAYVGEVIRHQTSGTWKMKLAWDQRTWEPWIVGHDGELYAPFYLVYRVLEDGRGESYIRGVVYGAVH